MGKAGKVGILYICTGNYVSFLENFLISSNKFLLPFSQKRFFIFTDSKFESTGDSSINIIPQPKLGYNQDTDTSYDSLMRYHIFLKHKHLFTDLEYLVFFNANTIFVDYILEQHFLPGDEHDGLVSVHHSGHYIMKKHWDGYDENSKSLSYIPKEERTKKYCQGSLIGGKVGNFLTMCQHISEQIDEDLSNNIHTKAWDEPYMNKYLFSRNPLVLTPGYSFPDNPDAHLLMKDLKTYALQLNKNNFGGLTYLRN